MPVTVSDSRSSIKSDPLRNFRFICQFTKPNVTTADKKVYDLATMGFMSVSGLNVENAVISYREGGMNTTPQRMPGQSEFSPITLSRGVMVNSPHANAWLREIFSVIAGDGSFSPAAGKDFRSNLDIAVLAHPYTANTSVPVKLRFRVFRCWPVSMGFSDLDAGGNSVLMEQMVLQHEGWLVNFANDSLTGEAEAFKGAKYT